MNPTEITEPAIWRRLALALAALLCILSIATLATRLSNPVPGAGASEIDRRLEDMTSALRRIAPQSGPTPVEDLAPLLANYLRVASALDDDPRVPPSTRQRLLRATEWVRQTPVIQRRLPLETSEAVRKALEIEFRAAVDLATGEVRSALAELRNPPAGMLAAERASGSLYLAVGGLMALVICGMLVYHEWLAAGGVRPRSSRPGLRPSRRRLLARPPASLARSTAVPCGSSATRSPRSTAIAICCSTC